MLYCQFNLKDSINTGESIVPIPYALNRIDALNFCRFSEEISKNNMSDEFKNPL
jgi:hypothetical protein